jgi:hypothetical protein
VSGSRRLLIKLVALETALVGWLSYWLFTVYASNPSVAQALADKLSKFPQFSFTTIDISVLVVIGVLSILLALKFQRGLRPGIRLERALQMLETLMKRNLFLESQVAELKLEKGQRASQPPSPSAASAEPQPGSWERAFRTPIEAGPGPGPSLTRPLQPGPTSPVPDRTPFLQPAPTTRTDTKPVAQPVSLPKFPNVIPERQETKLVDAKVTSDPEKTVSFSPGASPSIWEDSPRHVFETSGILNPPPEGRKLASTMPNSTLAKQASSLPPLGKAAPPPGVIVGPGSSPLSQRKPPLKPSPLLPLSKAGPLGLLGSSSQSSKPPATPPPAVPTVPAQQKPPEGESKPAGEWGGASESSGIEPSKPAGKIRQPAKRKFSFEEE